MNVFVQRKVGRASRFGFVRYSLLELASRAISLLHGAQVGG